MVQLGSYGSGQAHRMVETFYVALNKGALDLPYFCQRHRDYVFIVFLHTLGSLRSFHSERNILGTSQNLHKLLLKAGPKLEENKTVNSQKFVDISV